MNNKIEFTIPPDTRDNWQKIATLLVDILEISAGFITQISGEKVEIIKVSSREKTSLKEGDTLSLSDVFCLETAKSRKLVKIEDARKIKKWRNSPDLSRKFIAYLGIPILYPHSQKLFGTLCVADTNPRKFSSREENLLREFKRAIENQLENLTAGKLKERELKREKARFESLFYNSPDAIIMLDDKAGILDINKKFAELFKYKPENIRGRNVDDTMKVEDREDSVNEKWTEMLYRGKQISREVTRYDREGNPIEVFLKTVPITFENEVTGAYVIYVDITERKDKEKQLRYKTFHDELTGLYNRTFLAEEMDRLNTKRQHPISIIMVDVNGLKIINDSFGHDRGDEVLIKSARILESMVREEDFIARYGGDEFVILLNNTDNETAHAICERIEEKCAETEEDEFPVSLGMGAATKKDVEESINDVLKRADDNMLQNKLVSSRSCKNRIVRGLLNALAAKSDETKEHALRMTRLAHKLGEKIGISNSELNKLSLLATLHDIGKTSIPEKILCKPGDLTAEEWEMIKQHPKRGYKIASASQEFTAVADDILAHHERWDGRGYPRGLKKEEIPLMARIISIVDAYDVMTSGRPYKEPFGKIEALKEIEACSGTQFDPQLAAEFIEIMKK